MSWSSQKKKESIFCTVYFGRRKPFNIWLLSQCMVYWINFQNIYTFTNQNTLLHILLLVVFKTTESLECILKKVSWCYISKSKFYPLQGKWFANILILHHVKRCWIWIVYDVQINCVWNFSSQWYIYVHLNFFWCCLKGLLY